VLTKTFVIVTGMILISSLVEITPRYAHAEDRLANGGDVGAVEIQVRQPEVTSTADTAVKFNDSVVIKRKKSRNKSKASKNIKAINEMSPGAILTIKQVMELLKATRDLSGKNLSGLQLVGINLSKCNLKGADLHNANLERADLGESELDRADLSGANLKMVNLRASGMTATNLERAILDGAIWKDGRVCPPDSVGKCRDLSVTPLVK
jgi:hypothetical protein